MKKIAKIGMAALVAAAMAMSFMACNGDVAEEDAAEDVILQSQEYNISSPDEKWNANKTDDDAGDESDGVIAQVYLSNNATLKYKYLVAEVEQPANVAAFGEDAWSSLWCMDHTNWGWHSTNNNGTESIIVLDVSDIVGKESTIGMQLKFASSSDMTGTLTITKLYTTNVDPTAE